MVNKIIKRLKEKFGKESPLVTLQSKTVDYLGMCIDYTVKGKVKISMYDYIDKMLAELPSDMNGVSPPQLHCIYSMLMMAQRNWTKIRCICFTTWSQNYYT